MQGMRGMHTVWTRYGKGIRPSRKSFGLKYRGMAYRGAGGCVPLDQHEKLNWLSIPLRFRHGRVEVRSCDTRTSDQLSRSEMHFQNFPPREITRGLKNHPASLSFCWFSCANTDQNPHQSLENPDSAQPLVKSTNLLVFCTCIHRFSGRTVTSTDEPCRASGVGRRNGWWNEQPMRIGKSPPAQPEGETWSESSRGIAGSVRRCKSRCKPKVV
jgi:hypothetical protein